ncbi:RE1, partial [Symbiodinium pilosum]
VRAGGAVWLVKGRSLLKTSPEQLRRATEREEMLEALSEPSSQSTPWTFHTVAEQVGGNKFEDISKEVPDVTEWQRAQRPEEEIQPTRFRLRRKRPAPETTRDEEEEAIDIGPEEEPGGPTRGRSRSRERPPRGSTTEATAWWSTIPEREWPETQASYWCERDAAMEIEIPMPESKRGMNKALEDLGAYFVNNLKRRAVELSEKRMTAEEKEEFRGAKGVEIRNFLASEAFQVLPPHLRPDKSQAIGMRWILSWKLKEDGTRKAKARAVLLGYQDSAYEHRATTSPVMTRQTRQMVAQLATWKRWKLSKGDVTGAFLQSREYPDQLYCIPTPDICEALGVAPGTVTRVQKACYGLVDAPLEWWRSVDSFLQELGFQRTWADSCCWVLRKGGVLKGVISGHDDDFLFAGKSGDQFWEDKLEAIKQKFKWGAWDTGSFTQCGVLVEQGPAGIHLSQPSYLVIRWVHSEAQLANSLTKANGMREYELYSKMGHRWRLVEDTNMMSARRRKEELMLTHAKHAMDQKKAGALRVSVL